MPGNISCVCCHLLTFFKINFLYGCQTVKDPDQDRHHARIQKVLSEGVQPWRCFFFFYLNLEGREDPSTTHCKRAFIGPPAKRNGVSQEDRWWANIECKLGSCDFQGIRTCRLLLENPIFLLFFRGGSGPPVPPLETPMDILSIKINRPKPEAQTACKGYHGNSYGEEIR